MSNNNKKKYEVNLETLEEYQNLAIENASELLKEAKLLLENNFFARAYFIGCSSIEETGKAYIAFSAKGRNLKAVHKTLRDTFEKHPNKIQSAFICWLLASTNKEEDLVKIIDLSIHLKHGREKSMYVDINEDNSITIPSDVVRPVAATDCVRLAEKCLHFTKSHVAQNIPYKTSSSEDKLYCLNTKKLVALFNNEDFVEYLLSCLEKHSPSFDYSKHITNYHDAYFCKGKKFKQKIS